MELRQKFDDQHRLIQEWSEVDGVRHGIWRAWSSNGVLIFEAALENGLEEGESRMWDEAGSLVQVASFANGVLHGHFCSWWPNGQLKEEGEYREGQRIAPYVWYDQDGVVVQTYPESEPRSRPGRTFR
jgi:antitoxin component YwqK of YwqJK toxin-antitoxin module